MVLFWQGGIRMGRSKKSKKQGFLQQESTSFLISLISVSIIFIFIGYLMGQYALQSISTPKQQKSNDNQIALNKAIDTQLDNLSVQNSQPSTAEPNIDKETAQLRTATSELYRVQAGAFSQLSNAEAMAAQLEKAGFEAVISGGPPYRVQTGAFSSYENAELYANQLREKGFEAAVIHP